MAAIQRRPYNWVLTKNDDGATVDTLNVNWQYVSASNMLRTDQRWTIANLPYGGIGYVDMGLDSGDALARNRDWLNLTYNARSFATYKLLLKGVDYVSADANKLITLESVGPTGFTTNGSLYSIKLGVGNQTIVYQNATRDSTLFMGAGYDRVIFEDDPFTTAIETWALIRRDAGQIDAYNLVTGYKVRIEGGTVTWDSALGYTNYGEVEMIQTRNMVTGVTETYDPGDNLPKVTGGTDNVFTNLDLVSDDRNSDGIVDTYQPNLNGATDQTGGSFNYAYFNHIRYTTTNLYMGQSTVWANASLYSSPYTQTDNGTHNLPVAEQATAIDGRLRLYALNMSSGLYNYFNTVYLGTAAAENVDKSGYAATGASGFLPRDRVALYGFGGNDSLTGGGSSDYLFGGASTYDLTTGPTGNRITGGAGADYFGVGNTDAGGSLSGSGTDVILDWDAGTDALRILANGTAIIEGLYGTGSGAAGLTGNNTFDLRAKTPVASGVAATPTQNYDADSIDPFTASTLDAENIMDAARMGGILNEANDVTVINDGKIVALGWQGNDKMLDSPGVDYLYGGVGSNTIMLTGGGADRVYVDYVFRNGDRGLQYVGDFTDGGASGDVAYFNKLVVDSFGGNTGRALTTVDTAGTYIQAQAFTAQSGYYRNYLYDNYYNPNNPDTNANHLSQSSSANNTTEGIGVGLIVGGSILSIFSAYAGGLMIAAGTALQQDGTCHLNATYSANVGAYLNVIPRSAGVNAVGNTTLATDNNAGADNLKFLDFFPNAQPNDGFVPVIEFTAHSGQAIYGYFAVQSANETFIYLVASRDNLVENSEAIKVAEINGLLQANDFSIYNGDSDIYNPTTVAAVDIETPTITAVTNNASAAVPIGSTTTQPPLGVAGTITSGLAANSKIRLYDGPTQVGTEQTLAANTTNFNFTDSRSDLGTNLLQTDSNALSGDNNFELSDSKVWYSVELEDSLTGIVTRSNQWNITVAGGNGTLDGGAGTDNLTLTATSSFFNSIPDAQLQGIETITLNGSVGIQVSLANQGAVGETGGFKVDGSDYGDAITGSNQNDTLIGYNGNDTLQGGLGNDTLTGGNSTDQTSNGDDTFRVDSGSDTITDLGVGADVLIVSAGASATANVPSVTALEWVPTAATVNDGTVTVNLGLLALGVDLRSASGTSGFTVNMGADGDRAYGSDRADTINGGAGNDTFYTSPGADQINASTGNDTIRLASLSHTGWVVNGIDEGASSSDRFNVTSIAALLSNTNKQDLSTTTTTTTRYGLIALDGMDSTGDNLSTAVGGIYEGTGIEDGADASNVAHVAGWLDRATNNADYLNASALVFADGQAGGNTYVWFWQDQGGGDADVGELTLIGIFNGVEEAEDFLLNNVDGGP